MLASSVLFTLFAAVSARQCKDIAFSVSIAAGNLEFNIEAPTTKVGVTNFFLNLTRQGRNYPELISEGYAELDGDYELAATYCEPDDGPGSELQILTHGVGFDRRYWDFAYNDYEYSYVAEAVDKRGYSTFSWDRLGVGNSTKGDPIQEIQVFLETAALEDLTRKLREVSLDGIDTEFDRIVHVGHSFGSVMTYALASNAPELTDAIVLTGFSHVFDYIPLFALGNNFIPAKDICALKAQYPEGYIASASSVGHHIAFYSDGDFDPKLLAESYKSSQAAAPGELLTVAVPVQTESEYTGPVYIITGEKDVPFCGGDCFSTAGVNETLSTILDASRPYFPKASRFNATVVPGAGHGLNLSKSRNVTYGKIFDWLSS